MNITNLQLNFLHASNDGFQAALMLFLPFITERLNIGITEAGFLGTAIGFFSIVLGIPSAAIIRKFGERWTLSASMGFTTLGLLLLSTSNNFVGASVSFLIAGIGLALFHPVAFTLVTKYSEPNKVGKNIGAFTAVGDMGRVLFGFVAGTIAALLGVFMGSLLLGLVGIAACAVALQIKNPKRVPTNTQTKEHERLLKLIRDKDFVLPELVNLLDIIASTSVFIFLPFLLLEKQVSSSNLGLFTAIFFCGGVTGRYALGHLSDKYGKKLVFTLAQITMAALLAYITLTSSVIVLACISFVLGLGTTGTMPVLQSLLISKTAKNHERETVFSVNQTLANILMAVTPGMYGVLAANLGIAYVFYVCGAFALLALLPLVFVDMD
ncbi:MAG TPA: MFS transporter [Patescibacteria group bacterium]|nr:MFS transporter [Patescibacteria group bacterium]